MREPREKKPVSQIMDLFLHVAAQLGCNTDREVAELAEGTPENVANWRSGAVQEFKPQSLATIKRNLGARIATLREQARTGEDPSLGLHALMIEEGSSPSDLHRQFRERVVYDYLGHRFLYFEPQGALAWENLISAGYEQDTWLQGVAGCARAWLDPRKNEVSAAKGPVADALGLDGRRRPRGLDLICFGPGEGAKEVGVLRALLEMEDADHLRWLSFVLVDVSIPLLVSAARSARRMLAEQTDRRSVVVQPFCADFEEGNLAFRVRLPSSSQPEPDGLRWVLMLGNTFGNLRDEETFVRQKLSAVLRPGDFLWLEVGLRPSRIEDDPLFRLTDPAREETAGEANRRLLLEGPYRRWEAALGRQPSGLDLRVWVREDDDSCRIPGALNFCHDLVLKQERRVCTMLYSRRYTVEGLSTWFERLGFTVERITKVEDTKGRPRVAHLLIRKR